MLNVIAVVSDFPAHRPGLSDSSWQGGPASCGVSVLAHLQGGAGETTTRETPQDDQDTPAFGCKTCWQPQPDGTLCSVTATTPCSHHATYTYQMQVLVADCPCVCSMVWRLCSPAAFLLACCGVWSSDAAMLLLPAASKQAKPAEQLRWDPCYFVSLSGDVCTRSGYIKVLLACSCQGSVPAQPVSACGVL